MNINTLKTIFGYIGTLFRKINPWQTGSRRIDGIYNFVPITDHIYTSGQPSEAQFSVISAEGFTKVINLAPHGTENALADEPGVVAKAGMAYLHIPVKFDDPTDDDFARFQSQLEQSSGEKVWVHCAANMRVSAFMFRYRRDVLGEDLAAIEKDLHQIWEPFGVWRRFLGWSKEGSE